METLIENIRELMKKNYMSQKELALRTGLTEATISRYLHGTRRMSVKSLYYIARALGTTIDGLMKGVDWSEMYD